MRLRSKGTTTGGSTPAPPPGTPNSITLSLGASTKDTEVEVPGTPKTPVRPVRGLSLVAENGENVPEAGTPSRRTRRSSIAPEAVQEVPATPSRRGRRPSLVPEPVADVQVAGTPSRRTRRSSIAPEAVQEVPATPSRRGRRPSLVPESVQEAERAATPTLRKRTRESPAKEVPDTPSRRSARISLIRAASEEREISSPVKKPPVRGVRKSLLPLAESPENSLDDKLDGNGVIPNDSAKKSLKKKPKSLGTLDEENTSQSSQQSVSDCNEVVSEEVQNKKGKESPVAEKCSAENEVNTSFTKKSKKAKLNESGNKDSSPVKEVSVRKSLPNAEAGDSVPEDEVEVNTSFTTKKSKKAKLNLSGNKDSSPIKESSMRKSLTNAEAGEFEGGSVKKDKPKKKKSLGGEAGVPSFDKICSPRVVIDRLDDVILSDKKKAKDKGIISDILPEVPDEIPEIEESITKKDKKKKRKANDDDVVSTEVKKSKKSKRAEQESTLETSQFVDEEKPKKKSKKSKRAEEESTFETSQFVDEDKPKKKKKAKADDSVLANLSIELTPLPEHFLKDLAEVKPHSKIRQGLDVSQQSEDLEKKKKKKKRREMLESSTAGFVPLPSSAMTKFGAVSLGAMLPGREAAAANFKNERLFGKSTRRSPTTKLFSIMKKRTAHKLAS